METLFRKRLPAADTSCPSPPVGRGRYLPRHRARIIEQDNLLLVDFLEPESEQMDTEASHRRSAPWPTLLLWGISLSALTLELLRHL